MIELKFDDDFTGRFKRLISGVTNAAPLMRIVAGDMMDEVEENFAQQGRPKWLGLSRVTLERRVLKRAGKKGKTRKDGRVSKTAGTGAKILQDTGQLAASVREDSGATFARVGTNKVYAAMMQFGGKKSKFPNLWGDIPARPFLSITPGGEQKILSHTSQYLQNLID